MDKLMIRYKEILKAGFGYAEKEKGEAPTSTFEIFMGHFNEIGQEIEEEMMWKSMDSAPIDGKHVLVAIKTGAFVYTIEAAFMDGRWMNAGDIEGEYLAWMPKIRVPEKFLPWTDEYKIGVGV